MPQIKFKEVLSYSSEDPNNPADNLLRPETFRKWKCAPNKSEKQSFVILKFDHLTSINSLDIGNDGSALIEVLVSREGLNDYELLLVSSAFMTPAESRNETDLNRVRMFGPDKLNKNVAEQKWDRMKVICTQPFNTRMQYGLCFITARCLDSGKQESSQPITKLGSFTLKMEEDSDPISIGSMFAKRKEKTTLPVTGPAAIRAASRDIVGGGASPVVTPKRKDPPLDGGSSHLKKKAAIESIRSPISKDPPSTSSHTPNQNKGKQNEKQIKASTKPERTKDKPNPRDSGGKEKKEKSKESRNRKEEKVSSKPSSSKSDTTSETTRKRKSKPFNALMDDVVFVMSGYQNPERSTLRDKLTEMGGEYRSDWNPGCTHLICAFTNTPKYRQVKGKGRVVTGKWITESFKNKIRYPCRRYGLEKHTGGSESEEEIWAEEILPKVAKPNIKETKEATPPKPTDDSDTDLNYSDNEDTDDEIQKVLDRQQIKKEDVASDTEASSSNNYKRGSSESSKERDKAITTKQSVKGGEKERRAPQSTRDRSTSNGHKDSSDDEIYEADTDIDEELPDPSSLPLPILEDYFKGKCFFLYGTMAEKEKKLLTRYVIAYNGQIEDYMSEKVNFVLSDSKWDENFEEVLNENPALQFVKVQWIWQCCDKKKLVPHQPFLIVP